MTSWEKTMTSWEKWWSETLKPQLDEACTPEIVLICKNVARAAWEHVALITQTKLEGMERLSQFVKDKRFRDLLFTMFWKNAQHLTTMPQCEEAADLAMKLMDMVLNDPDYQNSVMHVGTYTGQVHCFDGIGLRKIRTFTYSRTLDMQKMMEQIKREEIENGWNAMEFVPHDSPKLVALNT